MRILYLSCHSIAEFEEVKLLTELGHKVVSQGAYRNPFHPSEKSRPPLKDAFYDEELASLAAELTYWGAPIPEGLIEWCDVIFIHGIESWLPPNWNKIRRKHVVFRSIGQSIPHTESVLARYRQEGLKIVRYSPFERNIPGYVGGDVIIRFYKDPEEYKNWNGRVKQVITVAQAMKKREQFLKFSLFEKVTRGLPRKLYGFNNNDVKFWGGDLTYEELKQVLRDNRVFFYTGTAPAPYTMAWIEALMTGIPTVCIGPSLAGWNIEVPYLIDNGVNGFTSNSLIELRKYVSALLDDHGLAERIGREGRKKAIELFGKEKIKKQWQEFFEGLE